MRMQRLPSASVVSVIAPAGKARPAALSAAGAREPATPISATSALASASFTLLRSTYIDSFFSTAGRMSADNASACPSASRHIRKLAIRRPFGEQ